MTYTFKKMIINELNVDSKFNDEDITNLFIPLLKTLTEIQKEKNKRIIVYLAAPPGCGKSTLCQFLQELSKSVDGVEEIQTIGMDGFHYPNSYLQTHHIDDDKEFNMLSTIKGAPKTFDVGKLKNYIINLQNENLIWPIYSRINHDVSDDGLVVDKKIVLLEGNYLLLDQKPWNQLIKYADYTISIKTAPDFLKDRLIERKIMGGSNQIEAIGHYEKIDKINIETVLNNSIKADLNLYLDENMKYQVI